jgi:phage terminase small subunit
VALNPKQSRFVAEYLKDSNATQAAIRAGYSAKTAYSQGHDLLKRPEIRAQIEEANSRRVKKLELSAEKVLEDIARIALSAEQAEDFGAALKGRELLGKHLKLFTDRVEHSADSSFAEVLKAARERVNAKR